MNDQYYTREPASASHPVSCTVLFRGHSLRFETDAGVFSKGELDQGTALLLEALPPLHGAVLDLGCGWGPVGISLKKDDPALQVTMVDVNLRALALSEKNARQNGVQAELLESDGFSALTGRRFDWVITNPPIRAGKQVIYQMFADAAALFLQDGSNFSSTVDLAAVIVDCLNFLAKLLPALVVPSTAAFAAQQIIIKSAPRYAERITEHMNAVLVMQIIERIQPVFQRCGRGAGRFLQNFNDALQPVHLVFQAAIFTQCETCSLLRIFGSFIGKPCINRAAWDSCFGDNQRYAFPAFVGCNHILFFF